MMKMTKYTIKRTNRFKKEYRKMKERKNFNEEKFMKVIEMIANDEVLPEKYCNYILEPKSEWNMGMPYFSWLALNVYKR